MNIFKELKRQQKLSEKRHPLFERGKFAKIIAYIFLIFWAGYLIFFGVAFAISLKDNSHNIEGYDIVNQGLIIYLFIDFLIRFKTTPKVAQEVKPYILLPIKKSKLIDFVTLKIGLKFSNLFWLLFFLPFAIFSTIPHYFGITGIITYCIGITLLTLINAYWQMLCKVLISEKIIWVILPFVFYGILIASTFTSIESLQINNITKALGRGYIEGNILTFLGSIAAIVILYFINKKVITSISFKELGKEKKVKKENVSEFSAFNRFGTLGDYMKLELKMLLRNKICKTSLKSAFLLVIIFSAAMAFSSVYDGERMRDFLLIYNFSIFGSMFVTQIFSFEGSHMDGLMVQKNSLHQLLRAKYYFYSIPVIIPFLITSMVSFAGKINFSTILSLVIFCVGFGYFMIFQIIPYNKTTTKLNEATNVRKVNSTTQIITSLCSFGVPLIVYETLKVFLETNTANIVILIIGLICIATSELWIRSVYKRCMKRKYVNLEGFRNTKN